ncbi:hypothetical protein GCM10027256_30260 [Novispirillum itersonii subsp. nipponicum]
MAQRPAQRGIGPALKRHNRSGGQGGQQGQQSGQNGHDGNSLFLLGESETLPGSFPIPAQKNSLSRRPGA